MLASRTAISGEPHLGTPVEGTLIVAGGTADLGPVLAVRRSDLDPGRRTAGTRAPTLAEAMKASPTTWMEQCR
jgi:hypothetical protein